MIISEKKLRGIIEGTYWRAFADGKIAGKKFNITKFETDLYWKDRLAYVIQLAIDKAKGKEEE